MNNPAAVCIVPYSDMMQTNVTGMAEHNDGITITRGFGYLPLMTVISVSNQRGIPPEYFPLNAGKPVVAVGLLSPLLVKVGQYPSHTRSPGNRAVV